MDYLGGIVCFLGASLMIFLVFIASAIRIVGENTRLSVYRLGRFIGDKGPGIVVLIPFIDRGVVKDLNVITPMPVPSLVGSLGESRTTIFTDGKIFVAGEEWPAVSQSLISAGERVRVVRILLEVEKA
jgi:regulator of protease activity HflC (stomatin/prohibitin superfamily)